MFTQSVTAHTPYPPQGFGRPSDTSHPSGKRQFGPPSTSTTFVPSSGKRHCGERSDTFHVQGLSAPYLLQTDAVAPQPPTPIVSNPKKLPQSGKTAAWDSQPKFQLLPAIGPYNNGIMYSGRRRSTANNDSTGFVAAMRAVGRDTGVRHGEKRFGNDHIYPVKHPLPTAPVKKQ